MLIRHLDSLLIPGMMAGYDLEVNRSERGRTMDRWVLSESSVMPRRILLVVSVFAAILGPLAVETGEVLYNGIVLPRRHDL